MVVSSPEAGDPGLGDESVVSTDRVLTVPNALSLIRLVAVAAFAWVLLTDRGRELGALLLVVSGITDYLDGYIARRWRQVSRLGQVLDPLVDRITIAVVLITLAWTSVIPWWLVLVLVARELFLVALILPLRSRGLVALPVHYLGKAATFVLFLGFPLILAGDGAAAWQAVASAVGWALIVWGVGLYWYGAVLYLEQTIRIVRTLPASSHRSSR